MDFLAVLAVLALEGLSSARSRGWRCPGRTR